MKEQKKQTIKHCSTWCRYHKALYLEVNGQLILFSIYEYCSCAMVMAWFCIIKSLYEVWGRLCKRQKEIITELNIHLSVFLSRNVFPLPLTEKTSSELKKKLGETKMKCSSEAERWVVTSHTSRWHSSGDGKRGEVKSWSHTCLALLSPRCIPLIM